MGGMPKVSQEHLERRRRQILDAARECFAKQGFHNTSMQDIFAASGLSAGAVYRYFPSKHALIKAIAEGALSALTQPMERIQAGPPAQILAGLAEVFTEDGPLTQAAPIAVQVWAEAFRDPELAAAGRELLGTLAGSIARMLPEGTPPEAARAIEAALQGLIIQQAIFGDVTPDFVRAAARAAFVS
jgi:TetR/AcrR family transcriptional regulator, transcriptional repressor of aconitase